MRIIPARPLPSPIRPLAIVVLGLVVGLLGTFIFRSVAPWGLVIAFAMVTGASIFARAWIGGAGVPCFGIGWIIAVQVLSLKGPGGDIVVPAHTLGYLWVFGGLVFVLLAAFAPRSWFNDLAFGGKNQEMTQGNTHHG